MINKIERTALFLLAFLLLLGILISSLHKTFHNTDIKIEHFDYGSMPADISASSNLININVSSAEKIATLPGIGPVIAGRIIDYRQQHGLFNSKDDLKNVKGIGDKLLNAIKDKISLN